MQQMRTLQLKIVVLIFFLLFALWRWSVYDFLKSEPDRVTERLISGDPDLKELFDLQSTLKEAIPISRKQSKVLPGCPEGPIVAVEDGGDLANKIWEYAAVWSLARMLGRPGFVPQTMLAKLSPVFTNLTLKTLESITHCNLTFGLPLNISHFPSFQVRVPVNFDEDQNILLPKYISFSEAAILSREQLKQEFAFSLNISKSVEKTLQTVNKGRKYLTYIGIHVRRGDYDQYLKSHFNRTLVGAEYFRQAMEWFRTRLKDSQLQFLVVSDDVEWCKKELEEGQKDVKVVSKDRGHDLALLAACNHSILDYGTFGAWGAVMRRPGGFTISLALFKYFDKGFKKGDPNWLVWEW